MKENMITLGLITVLILGIGAFAVSLSGCDTNVSLTNTGGGSSEPVVVKPEVVVID